MGGGCIELCVNVLSVVPSRVDGGDGQVDEDEDVDIDGINKCLMSG